MSIFCHLLLQFERSLYMIDRRYETDMRNNYRRMEPEMRSEFNRRMEFDRRHEMDRREEFSRRHDFDLRFPFWWLFFFL